MSIQHRLHAVAAATLAMLACTAAGAQTTPPAGPSTAPAADAAKDAKDAKEAREAKEAAQGTQTIMVTANRRLEEQQKVSGVVQSVSGEQLRKDGVQELRNLQMVIPGLSISTQEGAVDIYIRGVGTGNNTELGDPGAAPHINGVYLPRPRGMGLMFYDLERVEVNKGPQGTLYGRNAMAGTLNIITAKPKLGQTSGYIQGDLANRDGRGAEGAYNLPIGDNMAIRAAFQYAKRDMGYENVSGPKPGMSANETAAAELMATRKPAGLEDNFGVRLSYRWDIGPNTTLNVMADGGRETGTGYPGSNVRDAATFAGLNADQLDLRKIHYRGPQGKLTNDLYGLQAKLEHDFGTIGTELSLSRRSVDFFQSNASSAGVDYPGFTPTYDDYQSVFWQARSKANVGELRFYSTDTKAPLQWTAGAFTFSERQASAFFTLTDRGAFYSGTEFTMPDTRVKSNALYADGTFKVTTDTRVLGGLRYSTEKKSRFGIGGNLGFGAGGVGPGGDFDCCIGSRFGTDGFVPALLDRPNFTMFPITRDQFGNINEAQAAAQFLLQTIKVPGAKDTWVQQLTPVANGTNGAGSCVLTPEINPNGLACPPFNNGGYSFLAISALPIQQVGQTSARYGDFRIGFEHDLNKDQMVYAKLSSGHKGGGFNDSLANGTAPVYKPERVAVLEGGMRNAFDFGGRRALANVTAFYYDYKDYVLTSLSCTGTRINPTTGLEECAGSNLLLENAAGAKIKGLEMELRLPVMTGMQLDLNALLLDAKITGGKVSDARSVDFSGGPLATIIDVTGNDLPLAPKLTLTARLQQKFALGAGQFDWQLVATYKSKYYLDHFNNSDITLVNGTVVSASARGLEGSQKAYTQINLGAGYEFGNGMRVEGWITNVTDVQASQKRIVGQNFDLRFLNDARAYGLRARYTF
jgi:iron complex outermembrane recepter protein